MVAFKSTFVVEIKEIHLYMYIDQYIHLYDTYV